MDDPEVSEKQTRRRSRTVSWDHSVRAEGGGGGPLTFKTADRGVVLLPPSVQGPTSPGARDSPAVESFFDDDNMSISRGHSVERVRFSASRAHSDENDEDYSASVNAILHKRLSVRKGKHSKQRRSSSPVSSMVPDDASLISDRRRSSAFTTSSGDTAINIEDAGISQEQIFENIRLHKEVLSSVRQQPWSIRRKMKLVQQAKEYVKKHEGQLQERLAMSKSTRDILARFHILLVKQWQHSRREMANFISQIIPWELTIKEIESQFGTVVASYFTFLRWLFWVNFVISVLLAAFVVIPEVLILTTNKADTGERKTLLPEEEATSRELMTLLNFEGILQHSPIFYGYYTNRQSSDTGYRLPTAYFITGLVVYIYSFVATLRKMAANSRLSKLSEKDDECIFTWKLFTGWDYMIGNEETAHNRISSIILGFKEALLEEAERMKDKQNWKVVALRIFANLNMIWMLGSSVYAVIFVVGRTAEDDAETSFWRKYEITVVMTLIGTFFPIAFEVLGVLESYHPRTTLRVQLARIMALNLLNLYTLTFALFAKINDMTEELLKLKPSASNMMSTMTDNMTTTITNNLTTATKTTTKTTTTALPIITNLTTSTLVTLLMTTAMPNTTEQPLPIAHTVDLQPNCFQESIECPWMEGRSVSNASHRPTADVPARITPHVTEMANNWSSTTTAGFSPTVSSGPDRRGDSGNTGNTTENVDTLQITAEIVDDFSKPSSTEDTATTDTTNVSYTHGYDVTSNHPTVDGLVVTGSMEDGPTVDPVTSESILTSPTNVSDDFGSVATESMWSPTQSTVSETIPEVFAETTTSIMQDTEPTDADVFTAITTDRSIVTVTDYGDELYDTIIASEVPKMLPMAEIIDLSKRKRIIKRMPAVLFDGTHCFRVVCSPLSPVTSATEAPNVFRGFTEKSSKVYAATTEHEDAPREDLSLQATCLNLEIRQRLRKLCWETMFGQELVKLTVMDLVSTIISTIFVDFARALFVRYMNRCWCWNLEKRFPQYGDFKIAENILHLVNNQGMVWMGMFFSPGLPIINVVKLMIMMYVRSWAVLTCNVPHDVVFRASRSNNFYLGLLLTMLFLCVLPVGYAIVWIEPSWHCGPFSQYKKIYHIFTNSIKKAVPNPHVHKVLDYIASPAIVIPLLLLLILIIYYLASLTSSLREANNDLKTQLRRERTEERRKMFQLVNSKKRGSCVGDNNGDDDNYTCMDTTLAKWRHIMPDSKPGTDVPNSVFEIAEKKLTDNEVLDRVREKLVHMEADDQQSPETNDQSGREDHQQQPLQTRLQRKPQRHHLQNQPSQHHHHHHHHHQQHMYQHLRRPSRSEETRDTAAALRKWKKSKTVRQQSRSESESSDQSEAVPEVREPVQPPVAAHGSGTSHHRTTAASELPVGEAATEDGGPSTAVTDQPVKQKARLKLAQILYKEARRRRQKYVEELQNQQE